MQVSVCSQQLDLVRLEDTLKAVVSVNEGICVNEYLIFALCWPFFLMGKVCKLS